MEGVAAFAQILVAAQNRPALARVQVLGCLEAEAARLPVRAQLSAAPFAQVRLAGIFEYRNIVACGDGKNGVEIAGVPAQVHRNDGPGSRRNGGLDLARVHLERLRIRVHENRQRVLPQYHVDRGDKRVRRHQDLVARLDAQPVQAGEQRAGAVGRGQALLGAGQLRVGLFEPAHHRPAPAIPLSAAQRVEQSALLGLVEDRPLRERRGMSLGSAQNRGLVGRQVCRGRESRPRQRGGGHEASSSHGISLPEPILDYHHEFAGEFGRMWSEGAGRGIDPPRSLPADTGLALPKWMSSG